jgi:hypothetical protein
MRNAQISPERKGLYYFGMTLAVMGALSFASVFVSFAMHFGDFSNFEEQAKSMTTRAFGGMGLIVVGFVLLGIGRAGVAGSGVILDPEKARKDVEPWSRMTGGVVKDALDEAGITLGQTKDAGTLPFDEQLRRLHKLREEGIVSEQEYELKKKEILGAL